MEKELIFQELKLSDITGLMYESVFDLHLIVYDNILNKSQLKESPEKFFKLLIDKTQEIRKIDYFPYCNHYLIGDFCYMKHDPIHNRFYFNEYLYWYFELVFNIEKWYISTKLKELLYMYFENEGIIVGSYMLFNVFERRFKRYDIKLSRKEFNEKYNLSL